MTLQPTLYILNAYSWLELLAIYSCLQPSAVYSCLQLLAVYSCLSAVVTTSGTCSFLLNETAECDDWGLHSAHSTFPFCSAHKSLRPIVFLYKLLLMSTT